MPKKISSFLTLIITSFLVLSFGVLGSVTYSGFKEKEKARLNGEISLLTNIASKAFVHPLWTYDAVLAESMVHAFIDQNSTVKKIRLTYPDGTLVIESKTSDFDPKSELIDARQRVTFDGKEIGTVTLFYSTEKLEAATSSIKESIIFIFALVTLNLILLVTITLNFILGRPMKGLSQIAQAFREGRYEFEKPDWLYEFNEIGISFWQANQIIQERDQKIAEHRLNLENTIQQRTLELDEQRLQMVHQSRLASLGEFSAGVAHEINNPLAVIGGRGMIIKRKIEKYPELASVNSDLDKIANMVNRISKIIVGLRNFARDSSSEDKKLFEVSKLMEDVQDLSQARMNNRGIQFKFNVEPKDLKIFAREIQLSQVFINLLNNSIDAIDTLPDKWIEVSAWAESTYIYIRFQDSGNGISQEVRDKIFQPFFTTKEAGRGTGIGLSISMGIIRTHGGELYYDAKEAHTTFLIKIPAQAE